jgi:hypothetical protein
VQLQDLLVERLREFNFKSVPKCLCTKMWKGLGNIYKKGSLIAKVS